jgi:dCMP deaminase
MTGNSVPESLDWDTYFMTHAYLASMKSKDRSTKVGAVIVHAESRTPISSGFNSPCRGVDDTREDIHVRPLKYSFFEHAERNAIYNAARIGAKCEGAIMYASWCPCVDCARAIIQSGIKEIVTHKENPNNSGRWIENMHLAKEMLMDCGVVYREWSGWPATPFVVNSGKVIPNPYGAKTQDE